MILRTMSFFPSRVNRHPPPASHVGRPHKWPLRRIVEALLYLLRGGLPWRMLPPCFPPVSTVRRWFYLCRDYNCG